MTLKEFVEMVEQVSTSVKSEGDTSENATTPMSYGRDGGIRCSVCLRDDGSLSAEQTAICIQFSIPGKG